MIPPISKIPEIPTDNLYKFQGIIGYLLALIFYASIFFIILYCPASKSKLYADKASIVCELKQIDSICKLLDTEINKSCRRYTFQKHELGFITTSSKIVSEEEQLSFRMTDSLIKQKEKLLKKRDSLRINKASINTEIINRSLYDDDTIHISIIVVLFAFSFTFFLAGIKGFKKWELNHQRYIDAILMKEAGVDDTEIKSYLKNKRTKTRKKRKENKIT